VESNSCTTKDIVHEAILNRSKATRPLVISKIFFISLISSPVAFYLSEQYLLYSQYCKFQPTSNEKFFKPGDSLPPNFGGLKNGGYLVVNGDIHGIKPLHKYF